MSAAYTIPKDVHYEAYTLDGTVVLDLPAGSHSTDDAAEVAILETLIAAGLIYRDGEVAVVTPDVVVTVAHPGVLVRSESKTQAAFSDGIVYSWDAGDVVTVDPKHSAELLAMPQFSDGAAPAPEPAAAEDPAALSDEELEAATAPSAEDK